MSLAENLEMAQRASKVAYTVLRLIVPTSKALAMMTCQAAVSELRDLAEFLDELKD